MLTMQKPNHNFWNGKRVLLTGHTGFKGGWLSLWLQVMGATLRGIALPPITGPSLFKVARVDEGMQHRIADIRDYKAVWSQFNEFRPEIVIHMAAQPLVRLSYIEPVETYSTNVMGTVHVLEAARQVGSVKAIVNVTSDKCYENTEQARGFRESEPLGGADPYSSSKACAELVSNAYRKSFLKDAAISMATVRSGNVLGGGDWASDRLVPDVLRALEKNEPVLIRNPHAIRPWQHVLEPLSGYIQLAELLYVTGQCEAQAWNFGPTDDGARTVSSIVEILCESWGSSATWALQSGVHPHEAGCLRLDISKARQRLNWVPQWSLETALSRTTEWHRAWLRGYDMRKMCINQINQYVSLL
jgi:CDP-glucose 4,6-dehydratase